MRHFWSPCQLVRALFCLHHVYAARGLLSVCIGESPCTLVLSLTQSPFCGPHLKLVQGRLGRKCFAGVLEDAYTKETMAQYVFRRFVSEGRQAELLNLPPALNADLHAWLLRQACAALSPLRLWPCLSACKCMPGALQICEKVQHVKPTLRNPGCACA